MNYEFFAGPLEDANWCRPPAKYRHHLDIERSELDHLEETGFFELNRYENPVISMGARRWLHEQKIDWSFVMLPHGTLWRLEVPLKEHAMMVKLRWA